jgi:hypothetical protein
MKKLLILTAILLVACSDFTGPTPAAPTEAKNSRYMLASGNRIAAPTQVSNSRYILISGVWTCVEDCEEQQ